MTDGRPSCRRLHGDAASWPSSAGALLLAHRESGFRSLSHSFSSLKELLQFYLGRLSAGKVEARFEKHSNPALFSGISM